MKKTILVLFTGLAVLSAGCSKKTEDFVYLGQMYNTFEHATQTKIKGKVKEFKQTHFWAEDVNGKIVRGKSITLEDRKTLPIAFINFTEEYNQEGCVLKSTSFDENGKVLQEIRVEVDGKTIQKSGYYTNDTLSANVKYRYEGGNIVEALVYNPVKDTILMSAKYEYDQNGKINKIQTFNYKGEPQGYSLRTRNEKGREVKIENFNKDGKLTSQYDNIYDDKGDRIEAHQEVFTTGVVSIYTFKYEYDKMGNYTAIIFLKDNKPSIYRMREIKYYD
jgi:hypothetical protein